MKKAVFLAIILALVIVAGCVGSKGTQQQPQTPSAQQPSATTGYASAVDSGANSINSSAASIDSASSDISPNLSESDINLGI